MEIRKLFSAVAVFALSAVVSLGVNLGEVVAAERDRGYVSGEVLVKYTATAGVSSSEHLRAIRGARTLRSFARRRIQHMKLPAGMTVTEAVKTLEEDPRVEYVEPNYYRRVAATFPNDPFFGELWGLHNTGQFVQSAAGTEDSDGDVPEAWDIQKGKSSVVVAVLDTGVDWDHEDLAANMWGNGGEVENGADSDGNGFEDDIRGWDFVNGDNDPDDDNSDPYGTYHGTHVAGIIGAVGDNARGVVGVNWTVSLMALKILDDRGNGTVAEEIEAIDYAISNGAQIINASFSGDQFSQIEYEAIADAGAAGILFVAAAGNGGDDNAGSGWNNDGVGHDVYPASYALTNIVAVGASDQDDLLADFSNYGSTSVDVTAPGVNIYSTESGDTYDYKGGTSMATSHVSGLAGLILAENAGFTHSALKDRILNGVDVIPSLVGNILMAGRVNAYNSLSSPATPDPPDDLSASVVSDSRISLAWTDNAASESGFKIERRADGGAYAHVLSVPMDTEAYTDRGLRDGTRYSYRVQAFNAGGDSGHSNVDSATTSLGVPTGLATAAVSAQRIDLSWDDNSASESGYKIERKGRASGTYSEIATVGANRVDWSDTGLKASSRYYYRVKAYNGTGDSSYSNESDAKTLAPSGGGGGGRCFIGVLTDVL